MSEKLTILIVDDDALDRRAARRALSSLDMAGEIVEAEGGEQALAALSGRGPGRAFDAVLLDFHLPDADGLEVLGRMRAGGLSTPVIMLTGHGDEGTAVMLIKAGAADYLPKSGLSAERLGQSLRHVLRVREAQSEAAQADAERSRLTAHLAAEREQTEAILASMTDGLIVSDLAGNVLTMNRAALQMHGFEDVEEVRRPLAGFTELFELSAGGRVLPAGEWPLARVLCGEDFTHYEVAVRRRDTGRVWIGSYNGSLVRGKAGEVTLAILTLRDVTDRKRAQERAAFLAEAGARLSASLDVRTTLETVARLLVPQIADRCAVYAPEAGGDVRLLIAAPPPAAGESDIAAVAEVLRTGEPRFAPGMTGLCVPLAARGRVVGALALASAGAGRLYDDEDLALALELGRRLAAGLDNARLYDEVRARAERESMLNKIGAALRVSLDREEILGSVTAQVGPALSAGRCRFVEPDEARALPGGAAQWESGLPVVFEGKVSGDGAASIAAPVLLRGQLGGVLLVEHAGGPRAWMPDEVRFVGAVADILALALENSRLYAREHRVADMLSSAFLPDIPDMLPGLALASSYRAGLEEASVGGDYYDAFPLPDGRVALVIADVSGKGLHAAVQTATVKYSLRAFATEAAAPGLVLTRLNRTLCGDLAGLGDHFVTLFYAVFEPKTGRLAWASAGHESVMIKRADGPALLLDANGPILGLADHAYAQESAVLAPGDSLVLYTDGLTEARDGKTRAMLDIGGVRTLVESAPREAGPGALAAFLQQAAMRWTDGRPQDDMALLVARRLPWGQPGEGGDDAPARMRIAWEDPGESDSLFDFRFPSRADYVAEVRQALGHWMPTLGFNRVATEDFQTAVTEAVTNAVRHGSPTGASSEFRVQGRRTVENALCIEVTDSGLGIAPSRTYSVMPDPEALGGRGLPLMRELADSVEFRPSPAGLCVVLLKRRG